MPTTKRSVSLDAFQSRWVKYITIGFRGQEDLNVMTCKYGMSYIEGNSQPYFSITSWVETVMDHKGARVRTSSGGCNHNEIKRRLPELAELIPFHLWGQDGLPLHYLANAVYWAELDLGLSRWSGKTEVPQGYGSFFAVLADHIGCEVIGDADELKQRLFHFFNVWTVWDQPDMAKEGFARWLQSRDWRLRQAFLAATEKFGCELITLED